MALAASERLGGSVWVTGTVSDRVIPFAAVRDLIEVPDDGKTAAVLRAARESVADGLLLVVDDAHLLDHLSATLVYQLAVSGAVRLIVTVDPDEAAPDSITALQLDNVLPRIELDAPNVDRKRLDGLGAGVRRAASRRRRCRAGVPGRCRPDAVGRSVGAGRRRRGAGRAGRRRDHRRRRRRADRPPAVRRRGPRPDVRRGSACAANRTVRKAVRRAPGECRRPVAARRAGARQRQPATGLRRGGRRGRCAAARRPVAERAARRGGAGARPGPGRAADAWPRRWRGRAAAGRPTRCSPPSTRRPCRTRS